MQLEIYHLSMACVGDMRIEENEDEENANALNSVISDIHLTPFFLDI